MIKSRIAVVVILTLSLIAFSTNAIAFQGTDGSNGTDGVDGIPGTDGTDGENGGHDSNHVFGNQLYDFIYGNGGRGGDGGNGGNGSAGMLTVVADGGNGGNGGHGGSSTASWNARIGYRPYGFLYRNKVQAFSYGGHGGNGGIGGMGDSGGEDGLGGNGGNGGFAWSTGTGSREILVESYGGWGGRAYGAGQQAGYGGNTGASAFLINNNLDDGFFDRRLFARQIGGRGGVGFEGANGGNGGSTWFGNENSQFDIHSNSDQRYTFYGYGGSAGDSYGGIAGKGGHTTFDLTHMVQNGLSAPTGEPPSNSIHPGYRQDFHFEGYGGNGGRGFGTGGMTVHGGDAGSAILKSSEIVEHQETAVYFFRMKGGRGGNAEGQFNNGNGGDGGTAHTDSLQFTNYPAQLTSVSFSFEGGGGGHAMGSGNGGHGGSINLADRIIINGARSTISLSASGGDGGNGTVGGNGGDAVAILQNASFNSNGPVEGNSFFAQSTGGNAGVSRDGFARGGNAYTEIYHSGKVVSNVRGYALGGLAREGKSGDATAIVTGIAFEEFSSPYNQRQFVGARANGIQANLYPDQLVSIGTNATANATSIHYGNGIAVSDSDAHAGYGKDQSGTARSIATARNYGTGAAYSNASSTAKADRLASTANNATSIAYSSSNIGDSNADAFAKVLGHFNVATARANINDTGGFAQAQARTSTFRRPHSSSVITRILLHSGSYASTYTSSSQSAYRQSAIGNVDAVEAATHLMVNPHPTGVEEFVLGNDTIANTFQNGDHSRFSNVIGIGKFHGGYSNDLLAGNLSVISTFDTYVTLDDRFQNDDNMLLGLFRPKFTGDGFEMLHVKFQFESDVVVDETFSNVLDAFSYFDDNIIDLVWLGGDDVYKRIKMDLTMITTGTMDSFGFDFIFGDATYSNGQIRQAPLFFSSVPEPSGIMILSFCLLAMGSRRKRHR